MSARRFFFPAWLSPESLSARREEYLCPQIGLHFTISDISYIFTNYLPETSRFVANQCRVEGNFVLYLSQSEILFTTEDYLDMRRKGDLTPVSIWTNVKPDYIN